MLAVYPPAGADGVVCCGPPQDMDSAEFWKRFEASISTTCISEIKETLLGLSCLGTRGLLPLLANLARSFDKELLELHGFEDQLPGWLRVGGQGTVWPAHMLMQPWPAIAATGL
jgi:hypothetical protein